MARTGIETGFLLDQLWHLLRGEMDRSKEPALLLIGRIFAEAGVSYAVIGGIALQVHQPELRAGADPARRRSKRLQDLADAQALLEVFPGLASELSAEERARLDELPG